VVDHLLEARLAQCEQLRDDADVVVGKSIARRSIGSCTLPSISRVTTRGWPTVISKPSRRISSTSTAS